MDFGLAVPSSVDSWKIVKRAEELGFSHAWFYDTQMLCPDIFVAMALAAAHTSKIRLCTGVLIPSNRIAPVAANALASLSKLAPGRIICGISTGFTARNTMGLGPLKLSEMAEYIRILRGLLGGKTVEWSFEGKRRKIRFLNPEAGLIDLTHDIPIHISAFAPKARALTAETAQGWMTFLSLVPLAIYEVGEISSACRAVGRQPDTLYKTGFALGCVLAEGEAADSPRAKAQAGPFVSVMFHGLMEGSVDASMLPPDLHAAVEEFRAQFELYEPPDARYLQLHAGHMMWIRPEEERFVTADLIRTTTLTGTTAELRERIRTLEEAGYQQVAIQLTPGHEEAINDWADLAATI